MKKEVKTIISKQEVYVAEDGRQFDTEAACLEYEKALGIERDLDLRRCVELDGFAAFDGEEHEPQSNYYWYYLENMEDIRLLNGKFDIELDKSYIGEWIAIEEDYFESVSTFTSLDYCIRYAQKILNALGYEMNVMKIS